MHLDITVESSSLVSVLVREVFSHPYIHLLFLFTINGFCVTSFRTFFDDSFLSLCWWTVLVGGEELKWHQLAHHQLMNQSKTSF